MKCDTFVGPSHQLLSESEAVEQILVWGGRMSEAVTWRDKPELGGSGACPPQEMFLNIDALRSILGQFWHYL